MIGLRCVALSESSLVSFELQMNRISVLRERHASCPSLVSSMDRTRFAASTRVQYRLIDCTRGTIGLSAYPTHLIATWAQSGPQSLRLLLWRAQTRLVVLACRIFELLVRSICDCSAHLSLIGRLRIACPCLREMCGWLVCWVPHPSESWHSSQPYTQINLFVPRAMPRRASDMSSSPTDDSKLRHGKITKEPSTGTYVTRLFHSLQGQTCLADDRNQFRQHQALDRRGVSGGLFNAIGCTTGQRLQGYID